ncbi:MAG: HEAT repeat domain-containing protein [Anaerolineales bacterium]
MTGLAQLLSTLTSGDDERAEAAVEKIAAAGRGAVPFLQEMLSAPDGDTRWWAVRALAAIDHPNIAGILHAALHDPDPAVRQCAALGLCMHPTANTAPDLIAALESDDRLLARLAREALATMGSDAVPALLEVMERRPQAARLDAVQALAAIKDPRAIEAFFRAIRDGDSALIEYWADIGLEQMGVGMVFFTAPA